MVGEAVGYVLDQAMKAFNSSDIQSAYKLVK